MEGNTRSTAQAYLCDLMQFKGFVSEKYKNLCYIESLQRNHIMDYILCLQKQVDKRKYARTTFDRKVDSLIVFCKYLVAMEYKNEYLMKGYQVKRIKRRYSADYQSDFNPYIFSDSELENIIRSIQNSSDKNKIRDIAIIEMLMELGIRRSTLLAARWEDFDFVEKTLILHHVKDQITTKVAITDNLCNTLQNYQFVSNRSIGNVFLSNKGTPLSNSAFNDLIKKYLTQIGAYQRGATSHSFRHTFITKALKQNISPYKIIKYTGHRDISSLKPYENLIANDLSDVCVAVCLPINIQLINK